MYYYIINEYKMFLKENKKNFVNIINVNDKGKNEKKSSINA